MKKKKIKRKKWNIRSMAEYPEVDEALELYKDYEDFSEKVKFIFETSDRVIKETGSFFRKNDISFRYREFLKEKGFI